MKVDVHFFGIFRSITNRSEQRIAIPEGSTIRELLDKLIEQYDKMEPILSPRKIKESHVLVTHNEKPVRNYEKILADNDQIYIFIVLSGG